MTDDASEPVLDPMVLAALRSDLGADADAVLREIATSFAAEIACQHRALSEAADAPALARAAHRLRGSAVNVGARRLAALCRAVEAAALAGNEDGARTAAGRIAAELAPAGAAVAALVDGHA